MPPLAFNMFLLLAGRAGEVVPRNEIYASLWGEIIDDDKLTYDRQIDDHKRNIQDNLLNLCGRKRGITQKEIKSLIVTHKKIGLQLKLEPKQVEII